MVVREEGRPKKRARFFPDHPVVDEPVPVVAGLLIPDSRGFMEFVDLLDNSCVAVRSPLLAEIAPRFVTDLSKRNGFPTVLPANPIRLSGCDERMFALVPECYSLAIGVGVTGEHQYGGECGCGVHKISFLS